MVLTISRALICALVYSLLSACSGHDTTNQSTSISTALTSNQSGSELAQYPLLKAQTVSIKNDKASYQLQTTFDNFKPVVRIQNTSLFGAYFFTIHNEERVAALAANTRWQQEGTVFWASTLAGTGLNPVYRFRNKLNGSYLFTIYETERLEITNNFGASYSYEGIAWYTQQTPSAGWLPLYRFRNLINGSYLFTASEAEKSNILASYTSTFRFEGIAYYVWQDTTALADTTCSLANFQTDMLALVNAQRTSGATCRGINYPAVGALVWNTQLQQAATAHVTDMGNRDFFAHVGSDGSRLVQRLPAAGYIYSTAGENIAAGQTTVAQVVRDWMASDAGHCENTMNPVFRDIGVSCKTYPHSTYQTYWTMELGVR